MINKQIYVKKDLVITGTISITFEATNMASTQKFIADRMGPFLIVE